jgi:Fur family ferric uptake transcriptional regulator
LICTRCGKIQEFADASLHALREKVARGRGFTVTEHRLELYGFCRDCARLNRGRATRGVRASRAA